MSYELITVEKKDHLTIVTINRPEVMNSISPPTSAELSRAFNEFDEDSDAWVCIVTKTRMPGCVLLPVPATVHLLPAMT
jgi:crotonobetainyl-CoA hydratase